MAKWWAISILVIVLAEGAVCLGLFVTQSRVLAEVRRERDVVTRQSKELALAPQALGTLKDQLDAARASLAEMKLYTGERAQELVMDAVSGSNDPEGFRLLSLTPVKYTELAVSKVPGGAEALKSLPTVYWRLRLKGKFADLTECLHKLQQAGMLFEVSDFSADAIKSRGAIELDVVLKTVSPEALAKAEPEKAGKAPGEKQPAAKTGG